jgi:lincosamide nucleotidyltransferase A/C/D/E
MRATDVLAVLAALAEAGVPAWVAGGWGIDALVGETTRAHRDLDTAIPADQDELAISVLAPLGYRLTDDQRPARFVLSAPGGRVIDLHPVVFDAARHGIQQGTDGRVFDYPPDAFGQGMIGGVVVRCLSAEQQVRFHLGYDPLDHDRRDMAVLRDRLGIEVPPPY